MSTRPQRSGDQGPISTPTTAHGVTRMQARPTMHLDQHHAELVTSSGAPPPAAAAISPRGAMPSLGRQTVASLVWSAMFDSSARTPGTCLPTCSPPCPAKTDKGVRPSNVTPHAARTDPSSSVAAAPTRSSWTAPAAEALHLAQTAGRDLVGDRPPTKDPGPPNTTSQRVPVPKTAVSVRPPNTSGKGCRRPT